MLRVRSRRAASYKCPRHPRMQYGDVNQVPASCDVCHAIVAVQRALLNLDWAERKAERWVARGRLKEAPRAE